MKLFISIISLMVGEALAQNWFNLAGDVSYSSLTTPPKIKMIFKGHIVGSKNTVLASDDLRSLNAVRFSDLSVTSVLVDERTTFDICASPNSMMLII